MYFVFYKLLYKIQNVTMAKKILQTTCLQTLSQLMFNKFKQDRFDVKATASRMIRLTPRTL